MPPQATEPDRPARTVKLALLQAGLDIDDPADWTRYVNLLRWALALQERADKRRTARVKLILGAISLVSGTILTVGVQWLVALWPGK